MPKINKVSWGKVRIGGQNYHQVLIIGEEVLERDEKKLRTIFDTTHQIGEWEQKKLLSKNPEVVLIANGWSGVLRVSQEFKEKIKKAGVKLQTILTPRAIKKYHQLIDQDKRVNVLIHTTC